ncbi:conjugative transfer signal peptidase TraF [Vibrio sp. 10N.222.54.A1]
MKRFLIIVFIIVMVLVLGCYHVGYRFNLSASYPVGIYQVTPTQQYQPGDLVSFCPPSNDIIKMALSRGYLKHGLCAGGTTPLVKRIMAMNGERITLDGVVQINHNAWRDFPVRSVDSHHRLLPKLTDFTLQKGEAFLLSDYAPASSFDGRYFGAIQASSIIGKARPIFIF